ncbi:hypothetical protein Ga0102493_1118 [Erythrobacter litoralis]|uniref:Uncharacterized protein n=1 Tax=Erythrobacter litoralis TaxID=39960 RepID=A0A074NMS9_9SPHN|nr:hypothetical protein [Erythrobacter litoralis]AOL24165.1 hypothetical protein Ga0102493_1118 [Erythrobacter litoralis]KEO99097.1 hypothetical protein EH32_04555 [Erythrobacter litoralis]
MMVFGIVGAAALALSPVSASVPDVTVEFVDRVRRDAQNSLWHRYDFRFTNSGSEERILSLCPTEATLYFKNTMAGLTRLERLAASALAIDGESWSFNCRKRTIAPGDSVMLGIYFRWWEGDFRWWEGDGVRAVRPIMFETSLGKFFVKEGRIIALGEGDEETLAI